ncbi:imidazole glycerol phosphate synthase subunit HisH [Colwellia sp. MB3u-70]|uniref:imidazole glycerol phosphate synthase subunit HisH n=1 Tax=unclassified Colwellia TaxID=196834 RepID=UPI0015F41236|nr:MULTISPECIES: imidazole glycerol phosphate synthase subunit HisH [unclassified Colwellia]MBA6290910.1 imidazole glycerol phosphate synthase subunit HisH [Colwellia sp. MB3u-8]MBA6306401.1 imidazole glycerol phosphate synthase subunit HisH [Colwellia sp. MB3u-70]
MSENSQANFVIVDTGCANLASVKFAVERLGFAITISDDIKVIKNADKVILPGVGSARHAMENIRAKGLVATLQRLTQPVLGFCLGMQLMARTSAEGVGKDEVVECLGLIPTDIRPLEANTLRLPHMGWNTLTQVSDHAIFTGIKVDDYFYFVHSFAAPISEYTVARCHYGSEFSAAIAKDNFIGCQFHPERSSALGSKIIKNFLEM